MKAKGFTLIELLVVITIIGILATGATAVYSTAQEKSRDSVRISDTQAVSTAVQQAYTDDSAYAKDATELNALQADGYIAGLPTDPKTGNTGYDYYYVTGANAAAVADQTFEVSTLFENANNTSSKSAVDNGNDATRFEEGTAKATLTTDGASAGGNVTIKATAVAS